jgi:hypothetical protein
MITFSNEPSADHEGIPEHLVSRICETASMQHSPVLKILFKALTKESMTATRIRGVIADAQRKSSLSADSVRVYCHQLRDALAFYFLYTRQGVHEPLQIAFPDADIELQLPDVGQNPATGRMQRLYHLKTGPGVQNPVGAASFWHPHFLVGPNGERNGNAIVYTEPMAFRDIKNRFVIRHLDVNEVDGKGLEDTDFYVAELKKRLPFIAKLANNFVLSRAYVPGAEASGKDGIWNWLSTHSQKVGKMGHLAPPKDKLCKLAVSWNLQPVGDPRIANHHRILLGSARANSLIRVFQARTAKWMPFRIENDGIRVQCQQREIDLMEERLRALLGTYADPKRKMQNVVRSGKRPGSLVEVQLKEDWTNISFALISREIGLHSDEIITVVCANEGRSIQELGQTILTDDRGVSKLRESFGIDGWLPPAFQMVFAMAIDKGESRVSHWIPLLYQPVHTDVSRPERLRRHNWPERRINNARAASSPEPTQRSI